METTEGFTDAQITVLEKISSIGTMSVEDYNTLLKLKFDEAKLTEIFYALEGNVPIEPLLNDKLTAIQMRYIRSGCIYFEDDVQTFLNVVSYETPSDVIRTIVEAKKDGTDVTPYVRNSHDEMTILQIKAGIEDETISEEMLEFPWYCIEQMRACKREGVAYNKERVKILLSNADPMDAVTYFIRLRGDSSQTRRADSIMHFKK